MYSQSNSHNGLFGSANIIKYYISMSLKVIKMYEWLLDLYVLDFYVDNHWEKLPKVWREYFNHVNPQELGKIISGKTTNNVVPLSFLALIEAVRSLSIPRTNTCTADFKIGGSELIHNMCENHPKLRNIYLKHVKLKKRHEINLMSDVVHSIATLSKCGAVVDFGSGLGHLVRTLSYKKGLFAAGIECQTQLIEEARKLDYEFEYTAKKYLSEQDMLRLHRPIHYNITLTSHDQISYLQFPDTMKQYGLIGLHPCGDLGPLLLRHFVKYDHVKFICLVGCCYMKLSSDNNSNGYPMSKFVASLDNRLSYTSREIACHAIEVYSDKLLKGQYEDLKIHAYRAALERILVEQNSKLRHSPVRSIKHSDNMSFQNYCTLALERLEVLLPLSDDVWSHAEADLQHWRRVVVMYTLRLALAPLVETVILLDRVLYVMENGLSCQIHAVFDPKISPRNHIIVATR